MITVILAGGMGTRISEETGTIPKPMVQIGGKPILWHIMKIYSTQGFNEFVICLGYKGYAIKEYFLNYFMHNSNVSIDLADGKVDVHVSNSEKFKVTLVDTGLHTKTAGRLKRVREYLGDKEFMLTYGDGLADVDLDALLKFHAGHGKVASVTSVRPVRKFGELRLGSGGKVDHFKEKPDAGDSWINGGFFVFKPEIFRYLGQDADDVMLEDAVLEGLTRDGQLHAYQHRGFWKCMDAMRDKIELDHLLETHQAKWKIWDKR